MRPYREAGRNNGTIIMSKQINAPLEELIGLWLDPNSVDVQRIPALCCAIEELVAQGGGHVGIDRNLIRRLDLLAGNAVGRLVECMAIQTRTGCYSLRGDLEPSSCVTTSGWEG